MNLGPGIATFGTVGTWTSRGACWKESIRIGWLWVCFAVRRTLEWLKHDTAKAQIYGTLLTGSATEHCTTFITVVHAVLLLVRYSATVLAGHIRGLARPSVPYGRLTVKRNGAEKPKIGVNVSQAARQFYVQRSGWCFQLPLRNSRRTAV